MHKAIVIALAIVLVVAAGSPGTALAGPAGQNAPAIDGIVITSIPSWGQAYRKGDKIRVEVSFTETVTVTGAPQLALTIGSQTRQAAYDSSDTTPKALYFEYTVQSADSDTDGISINANALTLNDGTITSRGTLLTAPSLIWRALPAQPQHKVDGSVSNSVPSFASSARLAYEATVGTMSTYQIPTKATGGDGTLRYTLSNTGLLAPCTTAPGPSGASGVGGSSESLLPGGITYAPPSATDTHGGIITVAANTAAMPATCFRLVAQDADSLRGLDDVGMLHISIAVLNDYDVDNDGLIDVGSLAKLNAIRWDLDGDGNVVDTDVATYKSAFPNAMAGMGCLRDHDDDTATPKIAGCIGYELTANLDFDENNDGSITNADDDYWNGGKGWVPIGDRTTRFTATFDGNNKTISHLYINSTDGTADIGLFGVISKCDATGSNCTDRGVIKNLGLINASVTKSDASMGYVGSLAGRLLNGEVISCYATGSVSHPGPTTRPASSTGGLIGSIGNSGKVTASYATASVAGGATTSVVTNRVGGLVGRSSGTITASYAAGSVRETGRAISGGLVGYNNTRSGGVITASYAIGAVQRRDGGSNGGLVASNPLLSNGTSGVVSSYWDAGTTGKTTSGGATDVGATGKTTREMQSPTGYTGIYANWNVDLDGNGSNDAPWDFGTNRQYPVLNYGGLVPAKQRQTSIQSDNWNAPVVGEPVTATLNVTGATGVTWQWESFTAGSWTDIAGATSATYVPVAADAASGGKFLRAKVTFTESGKSRTLTTVNTAKVVAATTASAGTAATAVAMVGKQLSYQHAFVTAAGAANRTAWRWQRCDDAAMTTNCAYVAASTAATAEYTPVAGDVGKYLRAYAYYADSTNGNAWTRTQTPVLGPVVAAPAASP